MRLSDQNNKELAYTAQKLGIDVKSLLVARPAGFVQESRSSDVRSIPPISRFDGIEWSTVHRGRVYRMSTITGDRSRQAELPPHELSREFHRHGVFPRGSMRRSGNTRTPRGWPRGRCLFRQSSSVSGGRVRARRAVRRARPAGGSGLWSGPARAPLCGSRVRRSRRSTFLGRCWRWSARKRPRVGSS